MHVYYFDMYTCVNHLTPFSVWFYSEFNQVQRNVRDKSKVNQQLND
jgi:hypothetical protein